MGMAWLAVLAWLTLGADAQAAEVTAEDEPAFRPGGEFGVGGSFGAWSAYNQPLHVSARVGFRPTERVGFHLRGAFGAGIYRSVRQPFEAIPEAVESVSIRHRVDLSAEWLPATLHPEQSRLDVSLQAGGAVVNTEELSGSCRSRECASERWSDIRPAVVTSAGLRWELSNNLVLRSELRHTAWLEHHLNGSRALTRAVDVAFSVGASFPGPRR